MKGLGNFYFFQTTFEFQKFGSFKWLESMQNVIQMALKWQFFVRKITKIAQRPSVPRPPFCNMLGLYQIAQNAA